jgi:6-phosphogluconolactonase/glucosamine-6-phosphate isomerase/deaminase
MKVYRSSCPSADAGNALSALLRLISSEPVLLMVSGGSAFSILEHVEQDVLGPHVTVCLLDERFSDAPDVNNFLQLQQTDFYKQCVGAGVHVIATDGAAGTTIEGLVTHMDTALHQWKRTNPEGVVIATMGIGPDGHTAGIFPGEYGVDFEGDAWVVGYEVPKEVNQHTKRITVTHTFLRDIVDQAIVYAIGDEKRKYIELVERSMYDIKQFPASVVTQMKFVRLYTIA